MTRSPRIPAAAAVLTALAVLLTVAAPARAAVELLSNPGFEPGVAGSPDATSGGDKPGVDNTTTPPTLFGPWNGWNNWVSPYGFFYTSSVAHSGAQAAKTYSGPNGGVYQAVAGNAGDLYTASAWFIDRSTDAIAATATDDVRIIFQDASGNALTGGTFPSLPLSGATATPDTWTPESVTAIAPPGTAKVEVMAFFNNPAGAGGALYVDDMSLTDAGPAPEPASLGLLSLGALALLARRRRQVTA